MSWTAAGIALLALCVRRNDMTNDFPNSSIRISGLIDVSSGIGITVYSSTPRVLHVNGDSYTALVLATLLVPETHVTHVPTLAAAAKAIQGGAQFELLVLDPDLPDGDGAELIEAVRKSGAGTRVLVYSARLPERHDQASAFLPKPWTTPRQLWRTVSQLLGIGSLMPIEPQ